jgi:platelet-activating factor acetylhydrolase IB subunit alpha
MVLTDRQRHDLHTGIYEYLKSRDGDAFQLAAEAFAQADPTVLNVDKEDSNGNKSIMTTTLLEKKWTAIPRLQKKVLELERAAAHHLKIHAHRTGGGVDASSGSINAGARRMLPRMPAVHTLQGHSAVVLAVEVHPVFTVVVSGSEDGTIKVITHV